MRKKGLLLLLVLMLCATGCTQAEGAVEEEKDYSVHYTSEVPQEECCICGNNDRSLMGYYRKSGMVGLVCLNTMNISNLDTSRSNNN